MSKKTVPPDFMESFLSGKPGSAGEGPKEARQGPAKDPLKPRQGPEEGPLVQGKLWLTSEAWQALGRYFSARRIPVSTGLRGWIVERMEKEGLR